VTIPAKRRHRQRWTQRARTRSGFRVRGSFEDEIGRRRLSLERGERQGAGQHIGDPGCLESLVAATGGAGLACPVYFTQEDPIGLAGGLNLYGYADGDPINNQDPFGLWAVPLIRVGIVLATPAGRAGVERMVNVFAGVVSGALSGAITSPAPATGFGRAPSLAAASDATAVRSTRGGDLPAKGPPGSSAAKDDGKGNGQIRDYGKDGRAKTDYDFGHDHTGAGDPHAHDWDWTKKPPRQPPRPIEPNEKPSR
jgi:uncharacterized protein RhaS with RHS repeats